MFPADALREARALIADPEHWTQGTMARDASGRPCLPGAPNAVSRCAVGALFALNGGDEMRFMVKAGRSLGVGNITKINDGGTHEEVLALFDRAIEIAEAA